jgi:hypothetical protein
MNRKWVFYNAEQNLFWSFEHGWTTLDKAGVFTYDERCFFDLMLPGSWVEKDTLTA